MESWWQNKIIYKTVSPNFYPTRISLTIESWKTLISWQANFTKFPREWSMNVDTILNIKLFLLPREPKETLIETWQAKLISRNVLEILYKLTVRKNRQTKFANIHCEHIRIPNGIFYVNPTVHWIQSNIFILVSKSRPPPKVTLVFVLSLFKGISPLNSTRIGLLA